MYESFNVIICKCQLGLFMLQLYMWSLDMGYQRYIVDGRLCFDYDLQITSHGGL